VRSAIARLSASVVGLLYDKLHRVTDRGHANEILEAVSGIRNFFTHDLELTQCLVLLQPASAVAEHLDRREYGDYQTPQLLTDAVCSRLVQEQLVPSVVVEPTFGRGAFLVSALTHFPALQTVHGVEIHEPYCWQTKFAILELFLANPALNRPRIFLHCADVFRFDFRALASHFSVKDTVLVLGNPPWVTNAELGSMGSRNLPSKSNIKALRGLDAITGKGNFDIGEYIVITMLEAFSRCRGRLAMLAKNSVIRNVVHDLPRAKYHIGAMTARRIDARTHFGASVDASLFTCGLSADTDALTCRITSSESQTPTERVFGWVDGRFVSDVTKYAENRRYDGVSPLVWRQGVKHDCSQVMELRQRGPKYVNALGKELDLEPQPLYGLVKSSDLGSPVVVRPSRSVIITQSKVGEDTAHLAQDFPKLHRYLTDNAEALSQRKSSIYRDKPPFSIFGIGDYSFRPYKVAISGLYKRSTFTLILPHEGKPVMLDDTCYFLGFERASEAAIVWGLLNGEPVQQLLSSLVFLDAKRPFTKEVLMRIAIDKVASDAAFAALREKLGRMCPGLANDLTARDWQLFTESVGRGGQADDPMTLFPALAAHSGS
jgi:hypothetical protein